MPLESKILLLGATSTYGDALRRALGGERTLTVVTDHAAANEAEVILIRYDGELDSATESILSRYGDKAVLLTSREDRENINNLLARFPVAHVIGLNGQALEAELATTVRKILSGDIFGLEKYVNPAAKIAKRLIKSALDIDPAIEAMLVDLDLGDYFSATKEFLRLTVNEFLTNAVYNAPVDDTGKPKYETVDRKNKIVLADSEIVELTVASDADRIGVSVVDRFGRLTLDKMVRHFVKCVNNTAFVEDKKGGAGAGLYLAYYMSNQYVINVQPGARLEAICILEKNKRYKDYRNRITSFNFFTAKTGGAA